MKKLTMKLLKPILGLFLLIALVQTTHAVEVTFQVDMTNETVSPLGVHIAGNFQGWNPGGTELTLIADNIYAYTAEFNEGDYLEYKFVNGNAWGMDENVPASCGVLSGGSYNRYFNVPAEPTILPSICYGSCAPCSVNVDVTFQVDMSEQTVTTGVFVAGEFNGWNASSMPLSNMGNNIWARTVSLSPGETFEYKFINGGSWEQVAGACTQNGNRFVIVPDQNIILDAVCFGSCIPCSVPTVAVTFQVDMAFMDVPVEGVHIAGTFNDWDPTADEMTLVRNGLYEITLDLSAGDYIEYKYYNGNTAETQEWIPQECSSSSHRYLTIPEENTTLDAVCFGQCVACGSQPVDVQVTFQVDLSEQTVSPNGVHIAGTFQGWNPGSTAMTDAGGGIYTYTATFQSGYYHEYKFMNGITWDDAEFIPDPCAFNGNRFLTIPDVNTVVDVVCFASCEACPPPPEADITFQVDMSNEMVSINGVHISGTFNGFDPAATPMTDMGNNVYAVTLTLTEGDEHMYRFVNGNDVTGTEVVPPECSQEDGLRVLTVPGENTTLDLVCFGSCGPCIPPPEVNIIFNVDMSNETVSPDGVHLAGSFQGWDPTTTEMTETDAGVYAVTLILVAGDHHTYKFINGITFDDEENVPAECGEENGVGSYDRFIDIPENDSSLLAVCFGSCEECPPPPEVDISFQVDMSMQEISPDGIHLAGSFNSWNYSSLAMTDAGGGIYTAVVNLTAYEHQTYKFVNGTTLVQAEIVPVACAEGNPFAGYKRFFDVPDVNTTLDVVCFAECGPCIPPPTANVTFQVDMSTLPLSGEGVHVAGSFQGWDPATTELTDQGNGVYAVTLELLTGEHHTYKYINGNLFDNQETVPEACGEDDGFGSYNRFFDVPENDTVLDVVCFGMCAACPPTVEVTFQVDMAEQTVSPDGVHIAGSFQGWITDATAMTLVREGVYTYTTTLFSGEYYEYKFINGITWDDAEMVPAGCAQNENRFITATGDTVLSVVCFGSCVACAPPSVDVTFRVDMANETVSPDGVHIAGSFQGWDPAATPMTETTINIYSVTLALAVGEHHTYKFINGNTFDDQETVPEACGEPDGFGGFNRFIDVPDENTILTPVCFGGCNPCISGQLIDIPEGWSGLSAFAMPTNTNIETIFSGIFSDLIILQSMDGMYYPEQSINTIIDWESQSAYKIKVTDNALLNIEGNLEMNKTLDIPAGWSMMPVIHNEPVDVVELFSVARSQPIVVKGIASLAVYWPEFFINTLVNLEPGKAYYVKMDIPGSVTFPDYNVKSSASTFPVQIDPKTPWNKVTRTSSSHLFAIVANKVNNLQSGDVIGVFTTEGICAGLATIDNPDVNNVIAAYADENSTSAKDGFIDGEPVLFKIYRPVTSEIFDLNVEFDAQQPNGGQFTPEGLSVIKSLKVSPSGIGNVGLASIYLFPNPAEDNVTISGIQHFDKLVVYDAAGMVEKSKPLEGNNQIVMNTNDMAAGIYFVKISGKQHHVVKKLMVK